MASEDGSELAVADIRTALGEVDADEVPDSVISQRLTEAHLVATERIEADDLADMSQSLYDHVVTQEAAHRAFTSVPLEKQRSALDLSTTWDVTTYVAELRDRVESAWELTGETAGGSSAAFVDTTEGVFDQMDSKQ